MNLQEFTEIEETFMLESDDFNISNKASKILQARNFGGVPCFSTSKQEHGIVIIMIVDGESEVQTDAKTFIESLYQPENIDIEKMFEQGFYGLKYLFLSHDDDCVIESEIMNQNHINPFDYDEEGDFDILKSNAKKGSYSHLDVLNDELLEEKISQIQNEHDTAKKQSLKQEFMDSFFISSEELCNILKPNLKLVQ